MAIYNHYDKVQYTNTCIAPISFFSLFIIMLASATKSVLQRKFTIREFHWHSDPKVHTIFLSHALFMIRILFSNKREREIQNSESYNMRLLETNCNFFLLEGFERKFETIWIFFYFFYFVLEIISVHGS